MFSLDKPWARISCLIYSVHVTTTLFPILCEFIFSTLSVEAKTILIAIYSPYLLIPGYMAFRFAFYPFPLKSINKLKMK